ncbi:MAG: hypothetical protein HYV09_19880 [Deltaproteobacteria bacterium]|nr:hypothetical protein [Deltaproteobacteria bacterium]
MRTIYADFNDVAADGTLPLTCNGSVACISALGSPLEEGEEVCLSDTELRVRARVYLSEDGYWVARSDWLFDREHD